MPEGADVLRRDGPASVERFGEGLPPAIAAPWTIWSTAGPRPWADTCGRASTVARNMTSTLLAAIAVAPHATVRTPRRGWQSAGRHSYRSLTFTWSSPCLTSLGRSSVSINRTATVLIRAAADPHDVGGLIGVLWVLHTWTRTLAYHPHVHGLVPAGGVSADRTEWRPARIPTRCLSMPCRSSFAACFSIWRVRTAPI